MIIGICGFGYSGSGAVWDLLKESQDCELLGSEKEFDFLYAPDGLDDLKLHLVERPARFMASDIAVNRFIKYVERFYKGPWREEFHQDLFELTDCFLKRIIQVEWSGYWGWDIRNVQSSKLKNIEYRIRRRYNTYAAAHNRRQISVVRNRTMYLSIEPSSFAASAKEYVKSILDALNKNGNSETIILNQVFPANNPEPYMDYFDDSKAILVVRDPRDVYVSLRVIQDVGSRWFPHDDVEKFIQYYRIMHSRIRESERIKVVRFEDLIYDYDKTRQDIFDFCKLNSEHIKTEKAFAPEISIRNTALYLNNPQFENDIQRITEELKDYIYPFNEEEHIDHTGAF